jgi:hypothetical protein
MWISKTSVMCKPSGGWLLEKEEPEKEEPEKGGYNE